MNGTTEAFARVKIGALLQDAGWNLTDCSSVQFEYPLPDGTQADYVPCDRQAARAIAQRLDRVAAGNLGDVKPVGQGVIEMRIFAGPGYRLYFTIRDGELIILLCGGNKSSQSRDITCAQRILNELEA